jgi:hypothetical protein
MSEGLLHFETCRSALSTIADPQRNQIGCTKLAINCKIKHGKKPPLLSKLKSDPNSPYFSEFEGGTFAR